MAGKGFTVKKNWDNPKEHAMPAEARVPAEVRLGTVLVAPATVLAPMAGVTDTVFRRFIRHASLFSTAAQSDDKNNPEGSASSDGGFNPEGVGGFNPRIVPGESDAGFSPGAHRRRRNQHPIRLRLADDRVHFG